MDKGSSSIAKELVEEMESFDERVAAEKHMDLDLYLAAKNGDLADFKRILYGISTSDPRNYIFSSLNLVGNTFLHVVAKHGNQDIVKFIANMEPSLFFAKNFNRETALHLAAKGGYEQMVKAIVEVLPLDETPKRNLLIAENEMGNTALHQALLSHWKPVASFLIKQDSEQLYSLNKHGESAIYLAAKAGFVECVSSILAQCADKRRLNLLFKNKSPIQAAIERKDIGMYSIILIRFPICLVVRLAVNNKEMTALDVAYENNSDNISLRQRLTWAALKATSVPHHFSNREDSAARTVNAHANANNERVNTLLVVATLVATVTFAAGFTMPGGYISSETGTDLGMAAMWRHTVFHIFVLCDTIAMYTTSFVVVTALIWAKLGDNTLVLIALDLVAPLLRFALIMMPIAFTAGVITVVTKLRWLQIALFAMGVVGISFIALLLMLLLPLCASLTSRYSALRSLSYHPFRLLILLSYLQRNH